ncbi:hypothetical protein HMPREF1552_00967 [Leptotrichia sp. oral taxon 879 str. F0557]|nr:hypothetical protein HMPREF1552_00967 [Leptotrichia sp. oral taxon 879 str. F0557]
MSIVVKDGDYFIYWQNKTLESFNKLENQHVSFLSYVLKPSYFGFEYIDKL